MALQGKLRLDFAREKRVNNRIKREIVNRVERHNAITPWVQNMIQGGDFGCLLSNSKIMPMTQWFNGCLLTDQVNDPTKMMINGNSNVVAMAGNDAYTGTNAKRGSFNSSLSTTISSPNGFLGYRFVWDWSTDKGNGYISSVCLTRPALAIQDLDSTLSSTSISNQEVISSYENSSNSPACDFACLSAIDYANDKGYFIWVSNGVIYVDEYQISGTHLHLINGVYNATKLTNTPHAITPTTMNTGTYSASFVNGTLYLLTFSGSKMTIYTLDLSNDTCTMVERTYNGVTFRGITSDGVQVVNNLYPLINGYVWAVNSNGKMVKLNIANTDAQEFTPPVLFDNNDKNGLCIVLENGDFYKMYQSRNATTAVYYHNGVFYPAYLAFTNSGGYWYSHDRIHANHTGKGSIVMASGGRQSYNGNIADAGDVTVSMIHPFISTCSNLDQQVHKTSDLTMQLTYEITEVNPQS